MEVKVRNETYLFDFERVTYAQDTRSSKDLLPTPVERAGPVVGIELYTRPKNEQLICEYHTHEGRRRRTG